MERRLVLRKPLASAEPSVVKFIRFTTSSALRSCIQYFNKSVGLNVEREMGCPVNLRLTTWFPLMFHAMIDLIRAVIL